LSIEPAVPLRVWATGVDLRRVFVDGREECRRHVEIFHQRVAARTRLHLAGPADDGGRVDAIVIDGPLASVGKGAALFTDKHDERVIRQFVVIKNFHQCANLGIERGDFRIIGGQQFTGYGVVVQIRRHGQFGGIVESFGPASPRAVRIVRREYRQPRLCFVTVHKLGERSEVVLVAADGFKRKRLRRPDVRLRLEADAIAQSLEIGEHALRPVIDTGVVRIRPGTNTIQSGVKSVAGR